MVYSLNSKQIKALSAFLFEKNAIEIVDTSIIMA